jgi:hypothetical protein
MTAASAEKDSAPRRDAACLTQWITQLLVVSRLSSDDLLQIFSTAVPRLFLGFESRFLVDVAM